jgi:hypothetical protein
MKIFVPFVLIMVALLAANEAKASSLVWSQPPRAETSIIFGPSVQTQTTPPINSEVADDFDLVGTIDRIVAFGYRDFTAPPNPQLAGVFVRFYGWDGGAPGPLQAEYFVPTGSQGLVYDAANPTTLDVWLPSAFRATGKYFVSVQLVVQSGFFDAWYWWSTDRGQPRGSSPYQRDNLTGGNWVPGPTLPGGDFDAAFQLYGTLSGPARVDSLSSSSLARSGRLQIFGANFGASRGGGQVLVGGLPAIVSRWTDSLIVAYIPEAANLGLVEVQVVTASGPSNQLPLMVTARQSDGQVRWRFEVDGDYMTFRPATAPDGTIYVQDVNARLYALKPDGGLKWIFQGGPSFPSGPPTVAADGTVYIAMGWVIQAVNPNGTLKWRFDYPNSQGVIAGPAVGPDGRIYAVMDMTDSAVIALSPSNGQLLWKSPGTPRISENGQIGLELVFGPAGAGKPTDQFYFAADSGPGVYAFGLSGAQRWFLQAAFGSLLTPFTNAPQSAVGPDGTVYVGVSALNPSTGKVKWNASQALGGETALPVDVGSDGRVYISPTHNGSLAALNGQTGAVLWSVPLVGDGVGPVVSPGNDVVFVAGQDNFGLPGFFKAYSTDGQFLWQIDMQGVPYPGVFERPQSRGRFSADGATVYVTTNLSGEPVSEEHSYLYAIQITEAPPAAPALSSLTLNPTSVSGGGAVTGRISLTTSALPGGALVTLSSSNTSATVPASLMIPAGSTTATFEISTSQVSAVSAATVVANYNGVVKSAVLSIMPPQPPPPPPPSLMSLSVNPASITSGSSSVGTVTLSTAAPVGGVVVQISSNNPAVTAPQSVTVLAGATTFSFTVMSGSVAAPTNVTLTASYAGVSRTATLTVTPVAAGDTIGIQLAEYVASKHLLRVQATSTSNKSTLSVYATSSGQFIGKLTNNGGGFYSGQFAWPTNPQNITVKSSAGGSASKVVTSK